MNSTEKKFFSSNRTSDPTEKAVVDFLKRVNSTDKFVEKTVSRIGYARWDKIIKQSAKSYSTNLRNRDSADIYFIPFVRDSANAVNATMILSASSTDTSIRYLCDWQYRDTVTTGMSSRAQSLLLMNLDRNVFGDRLYRIKDTIAFGNDSNQKHIRFLKLSDENNSSANNLMVSVSISYCYEYWVSNDEGQLVGCPPGPTCTDWVYGYRCENYTYWAYVEDGGGSSGGGTGGTGGGGSGTGGSGGSTPPDCGVIPVDPLIAGRVVDPCDEGPGWVPEPLEDGPLPSVSVYIVTNTINVNFLV